MRGLLQILRQPLLHFLLIGAGLFWVFSLLNDPQPETDTSLIRVTPDQAARLATIYRQTWQRSPTVQELEGLIDSYIREEVLVREALALSMDSNDAVIRRRLTQKMEFLISSAAQSITPSEEDLTHFYQENADRYEIGAQVAFEQVFLGQGATEGDISAALTALQSGADPVGVGTTSLLPPAMPLSVRAQVAYTFGRGVFDDLSMAPVGEWAGPIQSTYGIHLVRVTEIEPAVLPPLDMIRDRVVTEWRDARSQDLVNTRIQDLIDAHEVERPDASAVLEGLE